MAKECTLIADKTDNAIQLLLGVIALSSLYGKWYFERPRRPMNVWFLDAMKQGTSALMIHILNIFMSIGISDHNGSQYADQCAFYFMNVVVDTTLGVYIAYLLLNVVTWAAQKYHWKALEQPGRYGEPPSLQTWFIQLFSWSSVLFIMKMIMAFSIFVFREPLGIVGGIIFYPFAEYPKIELLIVMIGCPFVMNMVQFWIQDSFLKDSNGNTTDPAYISAEMDGEGLPLLAPTAPFNRPATPSELESNGLSRAISANSGSHSQSGKWKSQENGASDSMHVEPTKPE